MALSSLHTYYKRQTDILVWLVLLTFVIHSCKENKGEVSSVSEIKNTGNQVHYISYGTDPDAEKWYEYNEAGDLTRQAIAKDTIVYEYVDHKIIKKHLDKKLNWLATVIYTTDMSGRIISSLLYDENDLEVSKFEFEYNAEGFLSISTEYVKLSGAAYINKFIYEKGNLKEVLTYNSQGEYSAKYAYEYFTELPNSFNMPLYQMWDDIFPNERLGKMNKNMISLMANISKEGDTLSLVKYRYDPITNGKLTEHQSDVLNEFDTDVIYHFSKHKN